MGARPWAQLSALPQTGMGCMPIILTLERRSFESNLSPTLMTSYCVNQKAVLFRLSLEHELKTQKQEDQKFKVISTCLVSLRLSRKQ